MYLNHCQCLAFDDLCELRSYLQPITTSQMKIRCQSDICDTKS